MLLAFYLAILVELPGFFSPNDEFGSLSASRNRATALLRLPCLNSSTESKFKCCHLNISQTLEIFSSVTKFPLITKFFKFLDNLTTGCFSLIGPVVFSLPDSCEPIVFFATFRDDELSLFFFGFFFEAFAANRSSFTEVIIFGT